MRNGIFVIVAVILWSRFAAAAKTSEAQRPVALFPLILAGAADEGTVAAIDDILAHAQTWVPDVATLSGTALDAKLRGSARTALSKCGDSVPCVVTLAQKIGAREIVIGRARDVAGGMRVVFVTVDGSDGNIVRKLSLVIAQQEDVASALGGSMYALLGIAEPGFVEISGLEDDTPVLIDNQLRGNGPRTYEVSAGRHTVSLSGFTNSVHVGPGKTVRMRKPDVQVSASQPTSVAKPMTIQVAPVAMSTARSLPGLAAPNRLLMYTGVGVAGVGAVGIIAAAIIGARALALNRSIGASTPQVEASTMNASAQRGATGANIAYAIGGVALAVGAGLFGASFLVPERSGK